MRPTNLPDISFHAFAFDIFQNGFLAAKIAILSRKNTMPLKLQWIIGFLAFKNNIVLNFSGLTFFSF